MLKLYAKSWIWFQPFSVGSWTSKRQKPLQVRHNKAGWRHSSNKKNDAVSLCSFLISASVSNLPWFQQALAAISGLESPLQMDSGMTAARSVLQTFLPLLPAQTVVEWSQGLMAPSRLLMTAHNPWRCSACQSATTDAIVWRALLLLCQLLVCEVFLRS